MNTMTKEPVIDGSNVTEHENMFFVTEASSLGLRAGDWPKAIRTTLGNGMPFVRTSAKMSAGDHDILWVTYYQELGCIRLRVFND